MGLHHARHDKVALAIDDLCSIVERWAAFTWPRVEDAAVVEHHMGIVTEVSFVDPCLVCVFAVNSDFGNGYRLVDITDCEEFEILNRSVSLDDIQDYFTQDEIGP